MFTTTIEKLLQLPSDILEALEILGQRETGSRNGRPAAAVRPAPDWKPTKPQAVSGFTACRVIQILQETPDTATLRLERPEGFQFIAGQFVSLHVQVGGQSHYRSYTISSAPEAGLLDITVKRVEGGVVSGCLIDSVKEGDYLELRGPAGRFHLDHVMEALSGRKGLLMVSAGSGATPMMSMLRDLYSRGTNVDVAWVHSARTAPDILYSKELGFLNDRMDLKRHFFLTRQNMAQVEEASRSLSAPVQKGRISAPELMQAVPDWKERVVLCCGPEEMMTKLGDYLAANGLEKSAWLTESFYSANPAGHKPAQTASSTDAAASVSAADSPAAEGTAANAAMSQETVHSRAAADAAPSGMTAASKNQNGRTAHQGANGGSIPANGTNGRSANDRTVTTISPARPAAQPAGAGLVFQKSEVLIEEPGDKTVLEHAEENGVEIEFSCLNGFCGVCKVRKLSGEVSMEFTEALSPEEEAEGIILACNAKCKGAVVIDA
jgi:ferredoxin-NADP reductase/ferredoxin